VEYLACEPTFRWCSGELFREFELDPEIAPSVWRALRPLDDPGHVEHVIVVGGYPDALGRAFLEFVDLAH